MNDITVLKRWIGGDESAQEMLARVPRPLSLLPPLHRVPFRVGNVVELVGPSSSAKTHILIQLLQEKKMPKVKTNRVKYPDGWELIEPTLRELQAKMREAENDPHDGKRKCEALWPIFKIAHQKSRYIFDLYHRRKEISKELYEFCLDQGYADCSLIAKWKKPGYERLCCLRCIQPRDHNFATTCVCRVPKHLREEKVIECVHCGCKGCASGD
ncbi:hypothetical protein L6164_001070 [Bauhinia variegata]|uniref:Uncharacterized protein n=1 Tax=Bauhinia variegata TaxID=167791 RepID=A0ACB9Q8D8_BAUVA|nr:hypothetical protein L6164_001070 [Bauhinia variegata]